MPETSYFVSTTYLRIFAKDPEVLQAMESVYGDQIEQIVEGDYVEGQAVELLYDYFYSRGLESWVLHFGEQTSLASHGSLGFAVLTAPDLNTALHTLAEYLSVRSSNLRGEFRVGSDSAHFLIHNEATSKHLRRWFTEFATFADLQLIKAIIGEPNGAEISIGFEHCRPDYADALDDLFGTKCLYNQEVSGIHFPSRWCRMASPMADFDAHQSNLLECQQLKLELSKRQKDAVIASRLAIESYFQARWRGKHAGSVPPSLVQLAETQYCSARTLARKLKIAGTSYKQILEDERLNHSRYLLKNTHLSIAEIADILAYRETANFVRAFKAWTNSTPAAWRRNSDD